jgi:hypothetical protein
MSRFVLPKTPQARKWVHCTDSLREHLKDRLAGLRARAELKRKESEEIERESVSLEQAIQLLDQLLPPKPDALPGPGGAVKDPTVAAVRTRWSLAYDACTGCGTTEKRHMGRGLCSTCYFHATHPQNGRVDVPVAR